MSKCYCPACGAENSPGAKFCMGCGVPFLQQNKCPSCGGTVLPQAAFCPSCGAPLSPAATAAPTTQPRQAPPPQMPFNHGKSQPTPLQTSDVEEFVDPDEFFDQEKPFSPPPQAQSAQQTQAPPQPQATPSPTRQFANEQQPLWNPTQAPPTTASAPGMASPSVPSQVSQGAGPGTPPPVTPHSSQMPYPGQVPPQAAGAPPVDPTMCPHQVGPVPGIPQQPWGAPPPQGSPYQQGGFVPGAPQWGPAPAPVQPAGQWGTVGQAWGGAQPQYPGAAPAAPTWTPATPPATVGPQDLSAYDDGDDDDDGDDPLTYLAQNGKKGIHGLRKGKMETANDDKSEKDDKKSIFQRVANRDGYYNDRQPIDSDLEYDEGRNIQWMPLILGIIGVVVFAILVIQLQRFL